MHIKKAKGIYKKGVLFEATFLAENEKNLIFEFCNEMGYSISFISGVPVIRHNGKSLYVQRKNGKLVLKGAKVNYNGKVIEKIEEDLHTNLYFFSIRDIFSRDTFWRLIRNNGFFDGFLKKGKINAKEFCKINYLEDSK